MRAFKGAWRCVRPCQPAALWRARRDRHAMHMWLGCPSFARHVHRPDGCLCCRDGLTDRGAMAPAAGSSWVFRVQQHTRVLSLLRHCWSMAS